MVIKNGFTFLGQTFRKSGKTLHIKPAKEGVLALKQKVGNLIRTHVGAPMSALVKKLNQALRGWGNYHRHVVAPEAFSRIDSYVYECLWRMIHQRHPKKSKKWLIHKYWNSTDRHHTFAVVAATKRGYNVYRVIRLSHIGIKRYIKIKADANPYEPEYARYFWCRRNKKESRLFPAMSAREYRAQSV